MRLKGSIYDKIETEVVDLFERITITKFPLDCFEICKQLNIKIVPYSSLSTNKRAKLNEASKDGFSVLMELKKGEFVWVIYYNDEMSAKRIRFTIMHELGHIILDHSEHSELAESEANYFARYALAPPPLVHQLHIEDYIELAGTFDLSDECAYYSMEKYNKWLAYHSRKPSKHEMMLVSLFQPVLGA